MEEDIENIEYRIKRFLDECEDGNFYWDNGVDAIKNLIKGYRELEEREIWSTATINGLKRDFIPKSKIKEKIEELEKEKEETYTKFLAGNRKDEFLSTKGKMLEGATQVLQELMEDK